MASPLPTNHITTRDRDDLELPHPVCETSSIYSWHICVYYSISYSGCCSVNPCLSYSCPVEARGKVASSTPIVTTTSPSSSSPPPPPPPLSLPSSSSTPGPTATSTQPVPYTDPTTTNGGSSHGMSLSVSVIVGIVVGCGIVAIFAALATTMWYGRHRRERREKRQNAQRLATPRHIDDELVPPGLESVFNPMASNGPGSVFDRAEGRMSKASAESFYPPVRENYMSGSPQFGLYVSHLSPNSAMNPRPSSVVPPELDSAPVIELPATSDSAQSTSYTHGISPTNEHIAELSATEGLRATLNSTPEDKMSNTYANSWSKF
ncbi:hypothetical protein QBC38DRAFT_370658 [Podospora fimiseda]|uniref:Uncharacterized protein n=1 Tax=Podospora fimiseda TaxID=252190 RepID=A0AAN7BJD9_9PEZI|nr:hypothetical protein QBC38DRAFT_370658 [Podospora fimiseda]